MGEGWKERDVRLRNAPEDEPRWRPRKKKRPPKKKAWCVEYHWNHSTLLGLCWHSRAYADEKGARMAFESSRHKAFGPDGHRLINPEGVMVDSYTKPPMPDYERR